MTTPHTPHASLEHVKARTQHFFHLSTIIFHLCHVFTTTPCGAQKATRRVYPGMSQFSVTPLVFFAIFFLLLELTAARAANDPERMEMYRGTPPLENPHLDGHEGVDGDRLGVFGEVGQHSKQRRAVPLLLSQAEDTAAAHRDARVAHRRDGVEAVLVVAAARHLGAESRLCTRTHTRALLYTPQLSLNSSVSSFTNRLKSRVFASIPLRP